MYFKIAKNNVRRSYKDYGIYFITLTISVCIFYAFNAIESQSTMLVLGESTSSIIKTLGMVLTGTSIFVSLILAGLITYANQFLLKKRSREMAVYMTLGMPKSGISKILILETFLIGVLSLTAGILLGIMLSQGLSVLTGNLLNVPLERFRFQVSAGAALKSVGYFGLIFLVVAFLDQWMIGRYELIELLQSSRKNEGMKVKNAFLSGILFLLSLAMLGTAYALVLKVGLLSDSVLLPVSIVLGTFGTFLFFFSLANFGIHWIVKRKSLYLKDLRMFVLRQLHYRLSSNYLSMSAICLMIFLTITLLFTMFGFKGSNDRMIEGNTPFDASAWILEEHNENRFTMEEYLEHLQFDFEETEKHSFFSVYRLYLTTEDLLKPYVSEDEWKEMQAEYLDKEVLAVTISDYNAMQALKGQEPVSLSTEEVLLVSNYGKINGGLARFMSENGKVTIQNRSVALKNQEPVLENILTTAISPNFLYFIVADDLVEELPLERTGFNAVFGEDTYRTSQEKFIGLSETFERNSYVNDHLVLAFSSTIDDVHARFYGVTAIVVFFGVYIGIVFLLASAAILALQQLSDANDSYGRYQSLRKIGVTEEQIRKAVLFQNALYFGVPFFLATVHAAVGMMAVNVIFRNYNQGTVLSSVGMIGGALIFIYGGYFYATYTGYRNIIKA